MFLRFTYIIGVVVVLSFFSSCFTIRVYEKTEGPIYIFNDSNISSNHSDSLTVLTFNIQKADKIQQAVSELQNFEKASSIDILLLQEMDETAVKSIAKELHLNYLYIPIVYNTMMKKDVGNAILARGKINNPEKLILPNKKWKNGRRRHVTIGEVNIDEKRVLVYSVHNETSSVSKQKRLGQLEAIIEHAFKQSIKYNYIIIGGDFNTLHKKDAELYVKLFHASGFNCATDSIGNTAKALFGLVKPTEDFIFYKGLSKIKAGKIEDSKASDHLPVYGVFGE